MFEDDNAKGVNAEHVRKLRQILGALQAAQTIDAMRLPTFGLHALKGDLKGCWAVTVRANWRVIFRFEDGKALRRFKSEVQRCSIDGMAE